MEFELPFAKLQADLELREKIMWGLLLFGALCLLFADPLADGLSGRQSGNSYSVDVALANRWAFKIQLWGAISFVAGLVERVALEIAMSKRQEQEASTHNNAVG